MLADKNTTDRIASLIHAADCERWLSWHGPEAERAAHAEQADALIEELKRRGVEWAEKSHATV